MIVLSYLWILWPRSRCVVEKNDPEVQWHAKHGLVLFVAEIILVVLIIVVAHHEYRRPRLPGLRASSVCSGR